MTMKVTEKRKQSLMGVWPTRRKIEEIQEYGTAITTRLGISTVSPTMASNRLYHLLSTFFEHGHHLWVSPFTVEPLPKEMSS